MTAAEVLDGDEDFFGDLAPIVDDDFAEFVREQDRHRSMTVVRDPGDRDVVAETRRWLDKVQADAGAVQACAAMARAVTRWADGSRDGQLRGAVALVRLDEQGHAGLAAALDELWSVRAKDGRDFRRIVEFARDRVTAAPTPPGERGCCPPAVGVVRKLTSSAPAAGPPATPEAPADESDLDSWAPVDLGPFLRGEVVPEPPSVGCARDDGTRLLYAGLEHVLIGESEAGKSWLALACVAAELAAGNRVVYVHFEESSPADTIMRLLLLDVSPSRIAAGLDFVAPEAPISPGVVARLTEVPPSLVVLDGVNEGMALHGLDIMKPEGPAAWRRLLVKPFTGVGAAVLGLDHVVKDREERGKGYAMGSAHKINGVNGAALLLENREPFGKGRRGRSSLYVVKDRPGELRRHGSATPTPRKFHLAELVVDAESGLRLDLYAGRDRDAEQDDGQRFAELDAAVLAAVCAITERGQEPNLRAVRAAVGRNAAATDTAIERLKFEGRLVESRGPNRRRLFSVGLSQDQDESESP